MPLGTRLAQRTRQPGLETPSHASRFRLKRSKLDAGTPMSIGDGPKPSPQAKVPASKTRAPAAETRIVTLVYKDAAADPVAASNPGDVTVRWRDAPINRPEGAVLGAQYIAVLDHGTTRFNLTVTSAMPAALLAGTGWHPGTVLHNLLRGEGDLVLADHVQRSAGRARRRQAHAPVERVRPEVQHVHVADRIDVLLHPVAHSLADVFRVATEDQ